MSTPSVFGLPEFMLEGDYMGMQTPHIVGMNNPITAFRENKQLKRHETPFDTRSAVFCFEDLLPALVAHCVLSSCQKAALDKRNCSAPCCCSFVLGLECSCTQDPLAFADAGHVAIMTVTLH